MAQRLGVWRAVPPLIVLCLTLRMTGHTGRDRDLGAPGDWMVEASSTAGIDFRHNNGATGRFLFPELMGAGVAMVDYDSDDDLDLVFAQGCGLGDQMAPTCAPTLLRNELNSGSGRVGATFVNVTKESGLMTRGYGMGVATGDYNNDGCVDLYLTSVGMSQLFRNDCGGRFVDTSEDSGAAVSGWSVAATFVDINADGWLDLFVTRYVKYAVETNRLCRSVLHPTVGYCGPLNYGPDTSVLLKNRADGTFTNISQQGGFDAAPSSSLGVATLDADRDGRLDLFVANDMRQNMLWMNRGGGTFAEEAVLRGVALSGSGTIKANMGVAVEDFDLDGDEDIAVSEMEGQGAMLFVNDGGGVYIDESVSRRLLTPTRRFTGFGIGWLRVNPDPWPDLFLVNGGMGVALRRGAAFRQPKQLIINDRGEFSDASSRAGAAMSRVEVGRGAAFGDIDNDGDVDVVVTNNGGAARLLLNTRIAQPRKSCWVGVRVLDRSGERDALGAFVTALSSGSAVQSRRIATDGSYASASDPRVLFQCANDRPITAMRVEWPDGRVDCLRNTARNTYTTVRYPVAPAPIARECRDEIR